MSARSKSPRYDDTLFAGTATYYARYRFFYPEALFAHLINVFSLNGAGLGLDLGCGTGQIAIRLAPHLAKVLAVDPDEEMLAEARRAANATGKANIEFLKGSSWQLPAFPGPLRITTIGQSFHWMDREDVLRRLYPQTVPGGGVAIIYQYSHGPAEYHEAEERTIREFLGERRRAGRGFYEEPTERHEAILAPSPFTILEPWSLSYEREQTIESAIGQIFSTSRASKRLLGSRADEFEATLTERLRNAFPRGSFTLRVDVTALLARK